jgi:hypothetical protein
MFKKQILFSLAIGLLFFVACVKPATKPNLSSIDVYSAYKVQTFLNNNVDQTVLFDGHQFQFGANGSLQASKIGLAYNGAWASANDSLFIKEFTTVPYTVLNGNWKINSIYPGSMDIEYSNGSNTKRLLLKQ